MDTKNTTLYDKVVDVTDAYFGPAAHRFVSRQIRSHLNIDPKKLKKGELTELINWIALATSVLTEDTSLVHDYVNDLKNLAKNNGHKA